MKSKLFDSSFYKYIFISICSLIVLTRSHNSISIFGHTLVDFTIPAIIVSAIYLRKYFFVNCIVLLSVAIDNYAILYDGVSANCITPGYLLLIASYYLLFWMSRYINSIEIGVSSLQVYLGLFLLISLQWFIATTSYYVFTEAFTNNGFSLYFDYLSKWFFVETIPSIFWLLFISILLSVNKVFSFSVLSSQSKNT
jgi:hypothetical protein